MRARLNDENQLTLPQPMVEALEPDRDFEVAVKGGRIVLTPARPPLPEEAIRLAERASRKLAAFGITEEDMGEAVAWARRR